MKLQTPRELEIWVTAQSEIMADVKFLLSFAPTDKPPEGLDPTFYHTLTHKGDLKLWDRVEKIRQHLELSGRE